MIRNLFLLLAVALASSSQAAKVVFVHGLMGFGPDELLGIGYWGFYGIGGSNLMGKVRDCGLFSCKNDVYYASVGPISSNWDRACELYAQIKGTVVDYGYWHSLKAGHNRFGKDYTGKGFYTNWGNTASDKIALVGHSMGGQTIRMLEFLLQKGATMANETNYPAGVPPPSPLFTGSGRNWIKSVHTIATPHNGSPLQTGLGKNILNLVKDFLFLLGSLISLTGNTFSWFYNFDLDHWGPLYAQQSGESSSAYFDRMFTFFNQSILTVGFTDMAHFDMGPEYAYWINSRTDLAYPQTYYFAHSTSQTYALGGNQVVDWDAEVLMAPTGMLIGSISENAYKCDTQITCTSANTWCQPGASATPQSFCWWGQETGISPNWEENDGLVPRRSSRGPEIGVPSNVYVKPASRDAALAGWWPFQYWTWSTGKWYERFHARDHIQAIGLRFNLLELDATDGIYESIRDEVNYAFGQ